MRRILVPVLIGLIGAAVLISLGMWQVQRLAWKEDVLARIDARLTDAPGAVPDAPEPARDRYAPVVLNGSVSGPELHVLIGHKKFGAGFRVVTRFDDVSGRRFLLDLGFVRDEDKDATRSLVTGEVLGNLHWPDDRNSSTPANDPDRNIWFARDLSQMAEVLGTEPVLIVLRQAGGLDQTVVPMPLDTSSIPNDHLNYAITWFSLATVWLGMTGFWLWRIRRRTI